MVQVEETDDQDQWTDAHDTAEDVFSMNGHPQGIEPVRHSGEQELAVTTSKLDAGQDKANSNPSESSRGPSMSAGERISNIGSIHSLPASHISETDHTLIRQPSGAPTVNSSQSSFRAPLSPPSRNVLDNNLTAMERRNRHRSAVEVRSSNRLSDFFTNIIHRRDPLTSPYSRGTIRRASPSNTPPRIAPQTRSRSSSPPARPITPPPKLPPPTLQELGLSLSVLTSDLSPSHFSTPPSSGAFLAPHFLLLCHAQGLDVLPLTSPPASQPYALVRRVSFKSVVVMEQRGVLVAIAGRRDGVRVYALEEIKRAVEWRLEVEVRRERDRLRRVVSKKTTRHSNDGSGSDHRDSTEKVSKSSLSPTTSADYIKGALARKPLNCHDSPAAVSLIPRTPTIKMPRASSQIPSEVAEPPSRPPPYASPTDIAQSLRNQTSMRSFVQGRSRSGSSNVLASAPMSCRNTEYDSRSRNRDSKIDWVESSDDEAINIVAAGSSGSQALDERTSTRVLNPPVVATQTPSTITRTSTSLTVRRNRPANLDLSFTNASSNSIIPPPPSPTPTLLTLRQALSYSANSGTTSVNALPDDPDTPMRDVDEDDDVNGHITLAQALFESRIPDLPPAGSRRPQLPILLTSYHPIATGGDGIPSSPRTSEYNSVLDRASEQTNGRRRRWSVLGTIFPQTSQPSLATASESLTTQTQTLVSNGSLPRSRSLRSSQPSPSGFAPLSPSATQLSSFSGLMLGSNLSRTRFIPRIISNAFHHKRSHDHAQSAFPKIADGGNTKKNPTTSIAAHAPPPKLEYVKLPGTKGAIVVKSVETAKKSFLAILCGENGEKVELFAGTYRTALGLSRTFILPDSPRSLELQLQGDDLVEVFLVFSQNVFGLEPATVRVREVRIGRAERRAARRRARGVRTGEPDINDVDGPPLGAGEEETNVNVSIGVSVSVGSTTVATGDGPQIPSLVPVEHPDQQRHDDTITPLNEPSASISHAEELVSLATARMGPYTTFQQLSFAPKFPLASIADEYIIPPTYPDFLDYRTEHEPEINGNSHLDLTQIQFSPPGLPVPLPVAPSKWFYRDPKNIIHGPWKASLMQAWYKDGLLPPDLPVRREGEAEYVLLKDLRLQSVDPTHPFRSPLPLTIQSASSLRDSAKPLLHPISLLAQPKHFGPPALFFSSRGGHSTTIVDARGRSVLKGRFVWSGADDNDNDEKPTLLRRMGDVKRLEAFDVQDRAVLVAMRQGGLEAVDLRDALLKPADESRTVLPQFSPPQSNINRRGPFVWKIGTPVSSSSTSSTVLSAKSKSSFITSKKSNTGSAKSPAGRTEFSLAGDPDSDLYDEVLFLGRKGDEIYICERNAGSFRILRLCPDLT